jgi:NAD(P)-dependent dehydrogenase (short-subunit alcohol dehydrogenase family)
MDPDGRGHHHPRAGGQVRSPATPDPARAAGVPADIARVALFLLSNAWSGYITGQNIAVDGGLSLHNWLDE